MRDKKRPSLQGVSSGSRRRAQHRNPKLHEKATAEALGGRTQKASGAMYDAKGDIADVSGGRFDFHGECKTTEGKSLRLEAQWLNKITSEAEALLKEPFLAIRFRQQVLDELASKLWCKLGRPAKTAERCGQTLPALNPGVERWPVDAPVVFRPGSR